jgi:CMP-N,N'-diacetyllegionaminic acid synthase
MEVLGIIGARAGSKGLPGKNIRPLAGRPLLAHAIRIAKDSRLITRVVLSTDSDEYATIGRQYGADTPFRRPAEHASDTAIELGYIRHAVEWLDEHEGYRPDIVVRICPTAPLIRPSDVNRCVEILRDDPTAHSCIIMTPAREHPRKAVRIADDGVHAVSYVSGLGREVAPSNRQSYAMAFNRQSLPIASRRDTILELNSQTGDTVRFHLVAEDTALDIDTACHFRTAECMLQGRV